MRIGHEKKLTESLTNDQLHGQSNEGSILQIFRSWKGSFAMFENS